MANGLYKKGKQAFASGGVNFLEAGDDIRVLPVRSSGGGAGPYYTVDLNTHDFLDDIPNNADCRPVAAQALDTQTATDGVCDALDEVISAFALGDPVQALVIYRHTGVESTSELLAYIDTGTNLPFTPNGGDVTLQWNASGIFEI